MKNLIYYPGFEVGNLDWLKFALLYIDVLNPIIPKSADRELSDLHLKLLGETDLIDSHRPDSGEGFRATLDAIEEIEKILKHPESFAILFGQNDFLDVWKRDHNYQLYGEKYSDEWKYFCEKAGLGESNDKGIKVNKDLGLIYMSLLAHAIADSRGISPITDQRCLDTYSIFTQRANTSDLEKTDIAQAVIELELPANLSQVKLDDVIAIRNQPDFKKRLGAFHNEFDSYFNNIEEGKTPGAFVNSFNGVWKDFSDDILQTGLAAMSFGIGVWIAIHASQLSNADYLKEIIAGSSLTAGGIISIRKTWKNTSTKRYARKYMTNLGKIKPTDLT